jgi:hypothetical protein
VVIFYLHLIYDTLQITDSDLGITVAYIEGQNFRGKCENILSKKLELSTTAIRQELNSWLLATTTTTTTQA